MSEIERKKRPVRKLTVDNFSVIKHAELEFGKITVLIGPPASGKSLLSKIAYFLGGEVIGIAVESLLNRNSWDDYLKSIRREFNSRFSTNGWLRTNSRASFSSQHYSAELRGVGDPVSPEIEFVFSDDFRDLYILISNNASKQPSYPNLALSELRQDLWVELSIPINKLRTQSNIYIPSGRAFFTDTARTVASLQSPDLDQFTRRFAGLIAWDTKWKAGLLSTGRNVVPEIEKEMNRIAGGIVIVDGGRPFFLSSDGRSLPLSLQSSGTQELLPMLNVVNYLAFHQEHFYARAASTKISPLADIIEYSPLIYLEEPEAHLFPEAQHKLVRLFAWLANDPILSFDWIITTHSPYILSSFNNLIEAGQAARNNPELHDAVAKIVPESHWIKDGDFKAYAIENGKLKSILNESGFIEGNYLDQVSEVIANEFDELLRLEYDHTKAS